MKVMILGGDGYLGWPTAMYFASKGHDVVVVDNYFRRLVAIETNSEPLVSLPVLEKRIRLFEEKTNKFIKLEVGDLVDSKFTFDLFESYKPDVCVHYAEQPSAPYSMKGFKEADVTFKNNLIVTFNVIHAIMTHCIDCHIVKLGTMGEYGTPNIDIEEGWIDIVHNDRTDKFLFPRQASSLYHTTKILDTDLLWFYVRNAGIKVTDLMQGPVYGVFTEESGFDGRLMTIFNYDDIFGTVVNRFIAQAAAEIPLTVYGRGGQTRGYINIKDTLQCVYLAASETLESGEMRIYNQFTETFTVLDIANKIQQAGELLGLDVQVQSIKNPRNELEDHYYNPKSTKLLELGLQPNYMTIETLRDMLKWVFENREYIENEKVQPRVTWPKR